jgi:hypothetical protein
MLVSVAMRIVCTGLFKMVAQEPNSHGMTNKKAG